MAMENILTYALVTVFVLTMMAFSILYHRALSKAAEEYERAKNVVKGIVTTLKKRQDGQKERIDQIVFDVEEGQAATDRVAIKLQGLENRIRDLLKNLKTTPTTNRELAENVKKIHREIQILSKTHENLQTQITNLNEKIQKTPRVDRIETKSSVEEQPLARITETERQILQTLVEEGPMTSPKVEKKIKKTREHTARLMKKLWQEGYIERYTHRTPFTYRPTNELKKILKKKKENKKTEKITPTIPRDQPRNT